VKIIFLKFDPEDGGSLFLRNLNINLHDFRMSRLREQNINFYICFKSGSLLKNHGLKIEIPFLFLGAPSYSCDITTCRSDIALYCY
jgi:hypothetical protein